ncbi:hypothetical protein [Limobrevibacterium gyesilva]|uniref:Lipoprotein n=1 Tax=Limobrevibacterium gyesilva TaxID=2991712 RepID=A0AA41YPR2_9PROT|nr:hypothetical protein [Limobrevibacterium gyesilva]MCW3477429.1 hypothetical protein [Limobrevibacterium gyesilva]
MRLLLAALIVASSLLAGCANMLAQRQAFLSQFIGRPEADLVRELGVPTRSFDTSGRRFLAYVDRRVELLPPPPMWGPWGPWGRFGYYGGFPAEVVELVCETTFEIADGTVRSFSLRGNACG